VPPGAVAIVGATPVSAASFAHWLAIVRRGNPDYGPKQAFAHTTAFLVKAQWLQQEARAEGINEAVLNQLVAARAARAGTLNGLAGADAAFQIRLDVIAEALRGRHRALAEFVRQYEARWRARTRCAAGYLAPECGGRPPP
jgi:hypothetical protein